MTTSREVHSCDHKTTYTRRILEGISITKALSSAAYVKSAVEVERGDATEGRYLYREAMGSFVCGSPTKHVPKSPKQLGLHPDEAKILPLEIRGRFCAFSRTLTVL